MNTAIIVAAGSGKRAGSAIPKQFVEINGKPLLGHTIKKFEACGAVDRIVLVVAEDEIGNCREIVEKYGFGKVGEIVPGGATRADSVVNGLAAVDGRAGIVAVHDGARPFVTPEEIAATIEKAAETGAACLVAAVTDTIKEVGNGRIQGTIDRNTLRRALTPQAFRYEILSAAYEQAGTGEYVTDECFVVEKAGHEIALVEGSARNIKITNPEDIAIAEILLK